MSWRCSSSVDRLFYEASSPWATNNLSSKPRFMSMPIFLRREPDGLLLAVKLQPRASTNEIGEPLGNELRIKVTAPPVDAAANAALVRLLAEHLGCSRNQVQLMRGHTSRHKVVKLYGIPVELAVTKLLPSRRGHE